MDNKFLGTGWTFPPEFFAGGAEVNMVSGEEDIEQSLRIILSTSLNERIMNHRFGCDLSPFMFEEANQSLVNNLRSMVTNAILNYEPRIQAETIQLDQEPENGVILISVDYVVRATNNRFNLVYPFYLNEASIPG